MTDTQSKALSIMRGLSQEERLYVMRQLRRENLRALAKAALAASANDMPMAALKLGVSLPTLYRWNQNVS